jgi:hypothetical protein
MKTILRTLAVTSLAIACAWPDVLPPPSRGERIKMRIVQDGAAAGGPVLEIPARLLHTRAALFDIAPRIPGFESGGGRTLIAGVLLSGAIFLFGRAFWKRRERKRKLPLVLAFAGLLTAGGLMRTAAADDYGRYDPGNLNSLGSSSPYGGTVAVQITDSGDAVILHLTPPRQPLYRPRPEPKPQQKQ